MKSIVYSLMVVLALPFVGCAADMAQEEGAAGNADALANPDEDEDLRWAREHGFGSILYMASCVSVGEDGSVIDSPDSLPVGNGRHLACTTFSAPFKASAGASSVDGEPWCVLGQAQSSSPGGDPRLSVQITSTPQSGPWSVVATASEPFDMHPVQSDFGQAWPLWVNIEYATLELRPAEAGKTCDEQFGL
jgi:hypothetical protein